MKKIILPAFILVIMILVYLKYSQPSVAAENKNENKTFSKTTPSKSLLDQIKQFQGLEKARLSEQELKSECKEDLEAVETLPLETLIYDLKNKKLNLKSDCFFIDRNTTPLLSGFPQICRNFENNEPTKECVEKLFFYKALRIHQATMKDNLDNLQTEIIINKLIGLLAENAVQTAGGLKMIRDVGAKLYERLPDSESAAKAAALGYLADDKLSDSDKVSYDEILNQARRKFPENWEIYEMDLIRRKMKNDNSFETEVLNYFQKNPSSGIANYYMGCLAWNKQNATEARSFFQIAAQLQSSDQRFSSTLQKSQTVNPPEKVCTVQVNFDPNQF